MTEQLIARRYHLERKLAQGGMGEVWLGTDTLLGRSVAIKFLNPTLAADQAAAARFKREALLAAAIRHDHIAQVYDYIEDDGRPGIVMALVEGETLAQRLHREGHLDAEEAVRIADAILAALEVAHRQGIIHRDVKPANILLTNTGDVKVADFGIARAAGDATLTATGAVLGTPHYTAPEQLRGGTATPATDIYAVGVVLYEMLTGLRPFDADTPIATALSRLTEQPKPLRSHRTDLSPALETVVMRALSLEPEGRYRTAAAMRKALRLDDVTMPIPTDAAATQVLPKREPADDGRRANRSRLRRALVALIIVGLAAASVTVALTREDSITIPELIGTTVEDAQRIAQGLGVGVTVEEVDSAEPRGTVLAQDIAAGTVVKQEGTNITLRVSDGTPACCTVPNIVGLQLGAARTKLEAAGLRSGETVYRIRPDGPEGVIVDQNPRSGVRLAPGAPVDLIVSRTSIQEEGSDDPPRGKGRGKDD